MLRWPWRFHRNLPFFPLFFLLAFLRHISSVKLSKFDLLHHYYVFCSCNSTHFYQLAFRRFAMMLLWETGEKRYYMVFLLFPPLIHRAPFVFLTCAFLGLEETIGRVGNWQSNGDGNPFQFHMKWTFEHSFILTLPHFNISFYVPFFRPWIRASFFKLQQHIVCIPNSIIPSNEGWW